MDCYEKRVECVDNEGTIRSIQGEKIPSRSSQTDIISARQVKRSVCIKVIKDILSFM